MLPREAGSDLLSIQLLNDSHLRIYRPFFVESTDTILDTGLYMYKTILTDFIIWCRALLRSRTVTELYEGLADH